VIRRWAIRPSGPAILAQARGRPREGGDRKAHRVIVVVLDHEGLLAAFRMPGHGAAGETPPAGLIERQGRD